jgi:hypothetical protein
MVQNSPYCICATPVLEILYILLLEFLCTTARTSCSTFSCGKEPVFLRVLCIFCYVLQYGIPQNGYHCQYSNTAAPFPLQNPYAKCMSAYSEFVNIGILTMTALQHSVATLAYSVQAGMQSSYSSSSSLFSTYSDNGVRSTHSLTFFAQRDL